jgi:hypothetical protein
MKGLDFIILGVAKAGTTSLYHYLKQYPDICLPRTKETWFFDSINYYKGLTYYYNNYFLEDHCKKVMGEIASSYLYIPFVPGRIKECLPDIKLIAILRNPVHRAYSDWWMLYSLGIESLTFEDALADNLNRLESGVSFDNEDRWQEHLSAIAEKGQLKYRTYLDYGYYEKQLHRYLEYFPKEQLKVFIFEDLKNPGRLVREILEFLKIDSNLKLIDASPKNVAIPSRFIGRLIKMAGKIKIDKILPIQIKKIMTKIITRMHKKTKLNPLTKNWLFDHYCAHNKRLEKLLDIDLPWSVK